MVDVVFRHVMTIHGQFSTCLFSTCLFTSSLSDTTGPVVSDKLDVNRSF